MIVNREKQMKMISSQEISIKKYNSSIRKTRIGMNKNFENSWISDSSKSRTRGVREIWVQQGHLSLMGLCDDLRSNSNPTEQRINIMSLRGSLWIVSIYSISRRMRNTSTWKLSSTLPVSIRWSMRTMDQYPKFTMMENSNTGKRYGSGCDRIPCWPKILNQVFSQINVPIVDQSSRSIL